MGWADDRLLAYRRGEPATWLERRMLEHANPVHFPLSVAASLGLAYGLWKHRWPWIAAAMAVAFAGHAYCWTRTSEEVADDHGIGMDRESGDASTKEAGPAEDLVSAEVAGG